MIPIFLDTEFTGLRQDTSLISLGLVSNDNTKFYAEFTDYDQTQVTDWIKENVIHNLNNNEVKNDPLLTFVKGTKEHIKDHLINWLEQFQAIQYQDKIDFIQIWSDVPHYDWVLFCELFGGALNIPSCIHYMPLDIATMLNARGVDYTKERKELLGDIMSNIKGRPHNALYDAIIAKKLYQKFY